MFATDCEKTSPFEESLKEQFALLGKEDSLFPMRMKAFDLLQEKGLPQRKQEGYQYVPLNDLYRTVYQVGKKKELSEEEILPHILPECRGSYLVFVNGSFCSELSEMQAKVTLMPLSAALRSYGTYLNTRLAKNLSGDPLSVLNLALCDEGAFLFIPPKMTLQAPIQILHFLQSDEPLLASSRLHVLVGSCSEVQLISTTFCQDPSIKAWINGFIDISLEESAHLHMMSTMHAADEVFHFDAVSATVKKEASLHAFSASFGGKSTRQDYRLALLGEQAEATLKSIALLKGAEQSHANVVMHHVSPHTRSHQLFKSVGGDVSQSSFEGKIHVEKEAQKTEAYQLNNHLLLGERAMANSKPTLEIFADDVKASHGATISQLSALQLFYLKTRGLSTSSAKKVLVHGFCKAVIDEFPHLGLRTNLLDKIQ
jgi:Fe-S cluster assembly protein SufD